jgi:S1-C subfamily serine protease
MLVAVVLLLAGVGIGTVGTGVIALSRMAQMQQAQQQRPAPSGQPAGQPAGQPSGRPAARPSGRPSVPSTAAPGPTRVAVGGRLGIEVVDAPTGPGALVVAVHEPGPGYTAGLVRGDVLLHLGTAAIGSASDLAAVVTDAQPGRELSLKVRHRNGREQELTVVPGVTI